MPEQTNILQAIKVIVQEENRSTKDELKDDIRNFKSEIINHVDAVMEEVKTMREEQSAIIHTLTDHEKRIDKIEVRVGV